MDNEEWLPVVGFEGLYVVSNCGRVKRVARERMRGNGHPYKVAEKLLNQVAMGRDGGYRGVGLKASGEGPRVNSRVHLVHRLVAVAFITNPGGLPEVNHKDMNKSNNTVGNLEWVSGKGNQEHAAKRGRFHGRTNPNARYKLQPKQVDEIKSLLAAKVRQHDIAEFFGISQSMVSMIKRGRTWANPAEMFAHVA